MIYLYPKNLLDFYWPHEDKNILRRMIKVNEYLLKVKEKYINNISIVHVLIEYALKGNGFKCK